MKYRLLAVCLFVQFFAANNAHAWRAGDAVTCEEYVETLRHYVPCTLSVSLEKSGGRGKILLVKKSSEGEVRAEFPFEKKAVERLDDLMAKAAKWAYKSQKHLETYNMMYGCVGNDKEGSCGVNPWAEAKNKITLRLFTIMNRDHEIIRMGFGLTGRDPSKISPLFFKEPDIHKLLQTVQSLESNPGENRVSYHDAQ